MSLITERIQNIIDTKVTEKNSGQNYLFSQVAILIFYCGNAEVRILFAEIPYVRHFGRVKKPVFLGPLVVGRTHYNNSNYYMRN